MISYYINYLEDDELVTETFEDFAGFLPFWNTQLCKINTRSIVIHCGRENIITEIPSDNHISDLVSKPVFFTESVKWCVPKLYRNTFANPIYELVIGEQKEKVRLYLSLYEWDYCISKKDIELLYVKFPEQTSRSEETFTSSKAHGWIKNLLECPSIYKSDEEILLSLGINNPEDYKQNYSILPDGLNYKCEKFRYLFHKNKILDYDLGALIEYMPYFLDGNGILTLNLSVRSTNGLMRSGCSKLGDLRNCHPAKLSCQRNMGKKSMKEIWDRISAFVEQSCSEDSSDLIDNPGIKIMHTFYENIHYSLNNHILESNKDVSRKKENRNKVKLDIVTSRLGLNKNGDMPTLEQLGNKHSVTRERIRQIFNKCVQTIILCEDWDDLMINKITDLMKENEQSCHPEPLFLDMLDTKDEWFRGFGKNMLALKNCIEAFSAQPKSTDISRYRKTAKSNKEINFTIIEPEQIARYIIFKPTPLIENSSDFNDFIKTLIAKIEAVIESNSWKLYDPNFHTALKGESQRIIEEECASHGIEILTNTISEIVIKHFNGNTTQQGKVDRCIVELFQNIDHSLSIDEITEHTRQHGIESGDRGLQALANASLRKLKSSIYCIGRGKYGNKKCYEKKYAHLGNSEINFYLNLVDEITSKKEFNEFTCRKLFDQIRKRVPASFFKDSWIDIYYLNLILERSKKYAAVDGPGRKFSFKRV